MIQLWINGTACDVPQDIQIEFTYKTSDADGLEAQSSNYSTKFALPRTPNNISIFTPLFDVRTVFGSASFDIHANAPAIIEVIGRSARGYIKMESIDASYHVRFIDGAGIMLEKMREKKLADVYLGYVPQNPQNSISVSYDSVYGHGSAAERFTFFPVFSDEEQRYSEYSFATDPVGTAYQDKFWYKYQDDTGWQTGSYELTHIQAKAYNATSLRCAIQMQFVFKRILAATGYNCDYSSDFFSDDNPYWKNLFMVLKSPQGDDNAPATYDASAWVPDMTCEDFILSYCKLFGLRIVVNGTKVDFLKRFEYYETGSVKDISDFVNRKIGLKVAPNKYQDTEVSCGLEMGDGEGATYNAGVKNAVNLYDGVAFKYADMMQYKGPRSNWAYDTLRDWYRAGTNTPAGEITLPYIESKDGGELVFRFNNRPTSYSGTVLFTLDYINAPIDGIDVRGAVKLTSVPVITTLNASAPLYAQRASIRYNYNYMVTTEGQYFYQDFFKEYIDEIRSKDNVFVSCEGMFSPELISHLASCRGIVNLDGARCRVIECVTNRIDRCKLTLQKITNVNNLDAGQGFAGWYLRGTTPNPFVNIPSSAAIGDVFPLPIDTNDTIASVVGTGTAYLSGSAAGLQVINTLPENTETVGGITANTPVYFLFTVTTTHGLTLQFRACVYKEEHAIDYYPDSINVSSLTGEQVVFPTLFDLPSDAVLLIYDDDNEVPFSEDAYFAISVTPSGRLSVRAKTLGARTMWIRVIARKGSTSTYYAMTTIIDINQTQ